MVLFKTRKHSNRTSLCSERKEIIYVNGPGFIALETYSGNSNVRAMIKIGSQEIQGLFELWSDSYLDKNSGPEWSPMKNRVAKEVKKEGPTLWLSNEQIMEFKLEEEEEVEVTLLSLSSIRRWERMEIMPETPLANFKLLPSSYCIIQQMSGVILRNGDTVQIQLRNGKQHLFRCECTGSGDEWGIVNEQTSLISIEKSIEGKFVQERKTLGNLISCYGDEGNRMQQLFSLAFENRTPCKNYGVLVPNNFLLIGTSGIGKTHLIENLSNYYGSKVLTVNLGDLSTKYPGKFGKGIREYFETAVKMEPTTLVFDNIETLFSSSETSESLNHYLLDILNELQSKEHRVLLVGTAESLVDVDHTLRKHFQDEIVLDIPTPEQRIHIFEACSKDINVPDTVIKSVSDKCHGYIAVDIELLCSLAKAKFSRNSNHILSANEFLPLMDAIKINTLREHSSIRKIEPVLWSDIGGLGQVKSALEESVIWLYKHADAFRRLGIRPSRGILLYGPPGTGKTLLAKAVATESSANFLPVLIPDLIKSEIGESEKALANIFRVAKRCSPCIVFLDELEALFGKRESAGNLGKKLISQLLLELDELNAVENGVVILAATNHPESIDKSILRPGRLDRLVYVPPPNLEERANILRIHLRKFPLEESFSFEDLAGMTSSYTGADLSAVARQAGIHALKRSRTSGTSQLIVKQEDFKSALKTVKASTNPVQLMRYQMFGGF
ncbi:hypothetical protein K7432_002501 [Basidiobolus ranarum]|uniref:AAA+ ATPase domain-containing protein n=1 Tax=Basidiobolus ranarum TaxID=34480 RepID=A0ABR2W7P8_9FUNG